MAKNNKNNDLLSPENIIAGMLLVWVLGIVICCIVVGPKIILQGSKAFYWQKHTCIVEGSDFDKAQADTPALIVKVRYEFNGRQYNTTRRLTGDSQQLLQRQMQLFLRSGDKVVCHINPNHPEEMMLDKEYTPFEIFLVMSISITGISFITGLVLLWRTWTGKNRRAARFRYLFRKVVVLMFSGFVVIASGTATIFGVVDAFQMLQTFGWMQVNATIKTSGVSEVREGQLWNYKYDLRYSYEFDGKQYEGTRWSLFDDEAFTKNKMRKALNALTPGQTAPCYVNSTNPNQAILDRRAGSFLGLFLVPIVTLIAAYIFWGTLREKEDYSKQSREVDPEQTNINEVADTAQYTYPPPNPDLLPKLPFHLQYKLNRRQRFVPHIKYWMPYWLICLLMLGGTLMGVIEVSWWFLPLFLFALWYVFWHSMGFFLGLLDVLFFQIEPMDLVIEENGIGFLVGDERRWLFLDGVILIDKLCKDTWTIYHHKDIIINIPDSVISNEQIAVLKCQIERFRKDPIRWQKIIQRERLIKKIMSEEEDDKL